MNTKQKWIAYGLTGVVGIGVIAGGAAATASAMDLRTTDGTTVPGGAITGREGGMLERGNVQLRVTDSSVTVVSAPSPTPVVVDSVAVGRLRPERPGPRAGRPRTGARTRGQPGLRPVGGLACFGGIGRLGRLQLTPRRTCPGASAPGHVRAQESTSSRRPAGARHPVRRATRRRCRPTGLASRRAATANPPARPSVRWGSRSA